MMIHDTTTFATKTRIMLDTWRGLWNDKKLPFYFVQIAPFNYSKRNDNLRHGADLLPYYWESQADFLKIPNTGMVVTTDLVDDLSNIHPSYKWVVGRRLSFWALANEYGKKIVYSGPLYRKMKIIKSRIILEFYHTGSGLISSDGKPLTWFCIAGKDHKFVHAEAVIEGDKVILTSTEVKNPIAVRFAWDETAQPNFYNKEKLPASPFRTDRW